MVHTTFVSPSSVATHLDGSWAIVDCRYDLQDAEHGAREYRRAHIPGAVYASLSHDLSGRPDGSSGRHPLPAIAEMSATFGRLGISGTTQVVAYDQDSGMFASRLWWMLRYLGHDAVAVLDGGWTRWVAEGHHTRDGDEGRPATSFAAMPRPAWIATAADVGDRLGDPSWLLVDARAPERFEGRSEPLDRAAGHIPGATNHHYRLNVSDEGTILPAPALRQRFDGLLGSHSPEQVVMYCGSGVSACHNLLAMEHVGLPGAKLYPGSWSEWSADPMRPVETGPARR